MMRIGLLFAVLVASGTLLFAPAPASAACELDESEIVIETPSGMIKTLCIPAAAVKGIENAADHSPGTIVATVCPCFSQAEINAVSGMSCDKSEHGECALDVSVACGGDDGSSFRAISTPVDNTCSDATYLCQSLLVPFTDITADEFEACFALLAPFL